MDILEQYEKDLPQVSRQVPQWESSGEYSGLIRLVMRFSGGRIQDERQANIVLVIVAVVIFIILLLILINQGGGPHVSSELIKLPPGPPILIPSSTP